MPLPLLRAKIVFDTQILDYVYRGSICPEDWNAVVKYISKNCRYAISANTLYELLAGIAKGDVNHFSENQSRIRLLCQPARREFLPTVGNFLRSKVFGLPPRKPDFQPKRLGLWTEVVLAAAGKSNLQSGVALHKAGHSSKTYGFDLQLLLNQIEEGKQSHSERLEGLRHGELLPSTDDSWSRSILNFIDLPVTDANARKILAALNAAHLYEISLYEMAKNHQYDFRKHDSDWIDAQQLYYLADPSVWFITCDANIRFRTIDSTQRDRILSFDELKAVAMNRTAVSRSTKKPERSYSPSPSR